MSIPGGDNEMMTLVVSAGDEAVDANEASFYELSYVPTLFDKMDAPFGQVDKLGRWNCVLNSATVIKNPDYWPASKDLLIRRFVVFPPGVTSLTLKASVHHKVIVYVNGKDVSAGGVESDTACPQKHNVELTIDVGEIHTGSNLFAFHVTGAAEVNFFDVELTAFTTTPADTARAAYTWGKGYFGVLGNGYELDNFQPTLIETTTEMAGKVPKQLALGVAHTLVLMEDGSLFGAGRNQEGQLGAITEFTESPVELPYTTGGAIDIADIASGSLHNLLLDSSGAVWCFGDNSKGQCGVGRNADGSLVKKVAEAARVDGVDNEVFAFIGARDEHSVAVTTSGGVFEWGNRLCEPTYINTVSEVVQLSVGSEHAMVLDSNGDVHVWGNNTVGVMGNGQIGIPAALARSNPTKLEINNTKMVYVACGSDNSFALSQDGKVFVWGGGGYGKNGLGRWANQDTPVLLEALQHKMIRKVASGPMLTLFLANTGEMFQTGANYVDGSHTVVPVRWPSASDKFFVDIYASHLHFAALTKPSEWTWSPIGATAYVTGTIDAHLGPS